MYLLADFPLVNSWVHLDKIIIFLLEWFALVIRKAKKKKKKRIRNINNFTITGIMVATYTCRYFSGHFIQLFQDELGNKINALYNICRCRQCAI